jgi:GNAT superfamily N-acetyltransferase
MATQAEVIIRKATAADIDAVVSVAEVVVPLMNAVGNYQWNDTYPLRTDFEKDVAENVLWVALCGDVIAGFAALTTDQEEEYADCGWDVTEKAIVPHRVAVDPQYRGKSIALRFMQQAEELAAAAGYRYVRVDTNVMNVAIQGLFAKLDYEYCGDISFRFNPEIYAKMRFKCYQKLIPIA